MLIFVFCYLVHSAENKPILTTQCEEGLYWSSLAYDCIQCWLNTTATDGCYYDSLTEYTAGTSITPATCLANGNYIMGRYCVTSDEVDTYVQSSPQSSFFTTYVNQNDQQLAKTMYMCAMIDTENANLTCSQYLANLCVTGHYNTEFCAPYNEKFPLTSQITGDRYGYRYWPSEDVIFIKYPQNIGLDSVMRENIFNSNFYSNQEIHFYIARYSQWGEFLGFSELLDDLQFCKESIDLAGEWRQFGHNYRSACLNNLKEFFGTVNNEYLDIFLQDGYDQSGFPIIRPIPVIDRLYTANENPRDNTDIQPSRRFFISTNWSGTNGATTEMQYISDVFIYFEINRDNKNTILPPYIDIHYSSAAPADYEQATTTYITDPRADAANTPFQFRVQYTMDASNFWNTVTILFVVVLVLAFVFWLICVFLYGRTNGEEGINGKIIAHCVSLLFDIIGTALYVLVFILCFYMFCFFKLQKSTHTTLQLESEYNQAYIVIWCAFAFKLIAALITIYDQANFDIYLVDWEQPKSEKLPVSTWRRIMIANEWNRILTIRSYNVPFTLIVMVFLLNGFDWWLMATPVPTTDHIDFGLYYKILTVALSTALFIAIIFIQYIWHFLVYWRFFGNPFLNFLDLCSNANISVLLMQSINHGHYLHGRSLHSHSDEPMSKLNENLEYEANGLVGDRGLLPNTKEQVFEVFLSQKFRTEFKNFMNQMQTTVPGVSITANAIQASSVKAASDMNEFLKKFFDGSRSDNKFQVQPMSFIHQILRYTPSPTEDSILTIEDESSFKNLLLSGVEWRLAAFYIIMFVAIEMETHSPGIAAFCVFIVDVIFIFAFNFLSKRNLALKSLLDKRFLL